MHASLPPRPSTAAYRASRVIAQATVYGFVLLLTTATIYVIGTLGGAW